MDPSPSPSNMILEFLVGVEQTCFHIYQSVLSTHSLRAFRKESIREDHPYEPGRIRLPNIEPGLFALLEIWLDRGTVDISDPTEYDPDTEISTWCFLHVLAKKFYIEDLADACLKGYGNCREPFWQGSWLPLPAEVRFAYDTPCPSQHTSSLKIFLVEYMTQQFFSCDRSANIENLAALLGVHQQFRVQVIRAHSAHMNMGPWDWAPYGCDVENCQLHPRWIDPNSGFIQVPLSREGKSGVNDSSTEVHEIHIKTDPDVDFMTDDEEALADAEMEEALAEAEEAKEQLRREAAAV